MAEVHEMHQSAVAFYLWGQDSADQEQFKNIRFVPAASGQFIAVASEVYTFDPKPQWVTCTTQFEQIFVSGRKELQVSSVQCL